MEKVKKQGMENLFCPYEQALALKELGFDEECFGTFIYKVPELQWELNFVISDNRYIGTIAAPTFSQAFRWFREKYNLECHIKSLYEQRKNKGFYFGIDDYTNRDFYSKPYYSYEEAELECFKKLIEIVKEKKI